MKKFWYGRRRRGGNGGHYILSLGEKAKDFILRWLILSRRKTRYPSAFHSSASVCPIPPSEQPVIKTDFGTDLEAIAVSILYSGVRLNEFESLMGKKFGVWLTNHVST